MELKPQTVLQGGRYVIQGVLGRGGFGVTYLAEQVMAKRKVCIKEFFPKDYYTRGDDTSSLTLASQGFAESMNRYKEKFVKEAQTIAALDHANIIPIYDVFEENNTAYYVMEYIDGESLSEVVKHRGALAESEAVEYVRQAASALEYLHDRKIMHLDIKPGNIMLRRKDNRVVLIDFGLSKHYDEHSGEATSTTPVGVSHGYAPLEQYKQGGVSTFSPETDIYSLGATLYYMVTGKVPPEAATLISEPLEFPQHVSATLRSAITAAMALSPKQRPASVGKFVAMFSGVGVSDKADETIVIAKPEKVVDEKPAPQSTNEGKPTPPTSNEDKPKTKKSRWWLWSLLVIVVIVAIRNCGGDDYDTYSADVYQENTVETDYIVTDQVDEVVTIDSAALFAPVTSDSPFDVVEVTEQSNPQLSLASKSSMSFDHDKSQGTIKYSLTNTDDVPNVTSNKSWITINSVSKSGTINFSVDTNGGKESRDATIKVEFGGQYFSVKLSQSGKPVLNLKSKESISFDHNKGQGTIDYSLTNSEDVPTVTCDKNWVTINSVSKSGTIKFSVAANSSEESRSATINVEYNGQHFNVTITQSGKPIQTYKVGDYYNENGKKGIVFEVWDGGRHGKIVSLDETKVAWDSRVKYNKDWEWINGTMTYADSHSDGKANTDKLISRNDSQYFLPAKWCRGEGVSWYLPAKNELKAIYYNKDIINNSLTQIGATTLKDFWYWSSTEEDEFCAWLVGMLSGSTRNDTKSYYYSVRAVSAF